MQQSDRVLDLCCGTGRHSLELACQEFDVVGVDRTASFIEKAEPRAAADNLKVEFIVGDMRNFCRPNRFHIAHTVSVRSYSAVELSWLLSDCGFADVKVYGDLTGRDYDLEAKRLVVVGTR